MEQKIIEHSFRTIIVDCHPQKQWTPRDEKLLNLYRQLHDIQIAISELYAALNKDYHALQREMEKMHTELKQVKLKFASLSRLADRIAELLQLKLDTREPFEALQLELKSANTAIHEFHHRLATLTGDVQETNQRREDLITDLETEEEILFEQLSQLKITYGYDDNLCIDYSSFDADEAQFLDKVNYKNRDQEAQLFFFDSTTENFCKLQLETEILYAQWQEFGKRLHLIKIFTGRDFGFLPISNN